MNAITQIAVRCVKAGTLVPSQAHVRTYFVLFVIPPSSTNIGHQPCGFADLVAFLMIVSFMRGVS